MVITWLARQLHCILWIVCKKFVCVICLQLAGSSSSSRLDLDMIRSIYGSGLAMRLATERRMACQVGGRILGSHESQVMYETVTGMDTTLDFSDFLGRPSDNPEGNALETAHTWMERKLQL